MRRRSTAILGLSGIFSTPLDERQTRNGPLLVLTENATAHALFQPSGDEARRIAANVAKLPELVSVQLSNACKAKSPAKPQWLKAQNSHLILQVVRRYTGRRRERLAHGSSQQARK